MQKQMSDNFVDLVLSSPPYNSLRSYSSSKKGKKKKKHNKFDFVGIAKQLYRVLKPGGVIVWVVGDATVKHSETGTSFEQALYFKNNLGLNLHDTMIFQKEIPTWNITSKRYKQHFEYIFVLSKGRPKTFNPIEDVPVKNMQPRLCKSNRNSDKPKYEFYIPKKKYTVRGNIWKYPVGSSSSSSKVAFKHPAIFPEALARDHILSWTNPDSEDIVFDPMAGSGTTGIEAYRLNRKFILCDLSKEYCNIVQERFLDTFGMKL